MRKTLSLLFCLSLLSSLAPGAGLARGSAPQSDPKMTKEERDKVIKILLD